MFLSHTYTTQVQAVTVGRLHKSAGQDTRHKHYFIHYNFIRAIVHLSVLPRRRASSDLQTRGYSEINELEVDQSSHFCPLTGVGFVKRAEASSAGGKHSQMRQESKCGHAAPATTHPATTTFPAYTLRPYALTATFLEFLFLSPSLSLYLRSYL